MRALETLTGPLPEPGAADLDGWLARLAGLGARFDAPIERAVAGGLAADRLGYAFVAGYRAAIDAGFGAGDRAAALCVTEAGGNHPRAIETRLDGSTLAGTKSFVTLGDRAELLWIAATAGPGADGRPQIRVVAIERDSPGVTLEPAAAIPFAPEVPHARVILDGVAVPDQPGLVEDGYPRIKAFRTVEDIHVHAAAVAYLIGAGRRAGREAAAIESLLASASALVALAEAPPLSPATHLALAGVIDGVAVPDAAAWPSEAERDRWLRDRRLLSVASTARAARLKRAREALAVI